MQPRTVALIVDDEFLARTMAAEIVAGAGFDVVEAPNADEGMRILQAHSDIRLVVTDIEMPGSMDGLELACAVRHRWPSIDVVVTSGRWRPGSDELPDCGRFMPKPFSPLDLAEILRSFGAEPTRPAGASAASEG